MQRITLTTSQREELEAVLHKHEGHAAQARRARCVLLWADGERRVDIRSQLACNDAFITRWTSAYHQLGVTGLVSIYPGRQPRQPTKYMEARVLDSTFQCTPKDGSPRWSSRKLAAELGDISFMTVQRIWNKHGASPSRLGRHTDSVNSGLEASKVPDIIGLYLSQPVYAGVFCMVEKNSAQPSDRRNRVPALSPKRAANHSLAYESNGALKLFAALNAASSEVFGKTATHLTNELFVSFLRDVVDSQPPSREIYVVYHNAASHKTTLVQRFLTQHPQIRIHYAASYTIWLNQVEIWLTRLWRDAIAGNTSTSIQKLDKELMHHIRQYSQATKPIEWKYISPLRHTATNPSITAD